MPLRVAYVLGQFPSLTETFILREILALREMGARVTLFALQRGEVCLAPDVARRWAAGLRTPSLWSGLRAALRRPERALRFLAHAARVERPRGWVQHLRHALSGWGWAPALQHVRAQAVHAHFAGLPAWAAWAAADYLDLPFSFSAHAWDIEFETELLPAKLAAARFVTTCSAFNRDRLEARCPGSADRVRLLYHGLESEWFRPSARLNLRAVLPDARFPAGGGPLLLAVGRLVPKKGFQVMLDAAEHLARAGVSFQMVVVGDGPLRTWLAEQARRPVLRGRVWMAGARSPDEVRRIYAAADLLVQPSIVTPQGDRDGLPNVILEAMACGLPVVASRVAALPEAVEDGITGYLAPPGDAAVLAAVLRQTLAEAARWPQLGQAARQRVKERFRLERNVAVLKEWLEEGLI